MGKVFNLGIQTHVSDVFFDVCRYVFDFFSPFGAASRLHWTGLIAFLLLGIGIYILKFKSKGEGGTNSSKDVKGLFGFLFPKKIYTTNSFRLDVKLYFANKLLSPVTSLVSKGLTIAIAIFVIDLGQKLTGDVWVEAAPDSSPGFWAVFWATTIIVIATDFAIYLTHRLHHENPVLWPFHKVHHSAEHLTPITLYRKHPIYDFLGSLVKGSLLGVATGIVLFLFGIVEVKTVLGVQVFYFAFNLMGANLRHSHIWLSYGNVLSHILISPAQHQIHHSKAPKHHDKNYGQLLAIWDWMFGTLYIPKTREEIAFGVADEYGVDLPQVHNSLVQAYITPFKEARLALNKVKESRRDDSGDPIGTTL